MHSPTTDSAKTHSRFTVGSLSDISSLRKLDSDHTPDFDILEVRVDGLLQNELEEAFRLCLRFKSWNVPILITLRDVSEGGIHPLSTEQKLARIEQFAEVASYLDVEIANYPEMEISLKKHQAAGIHLVLSYHNFEHTPDNLAEKYRQGIAYQADIVKFALMHKTVHDIVTCSEFLQSVTTPVSVMGMGSLAPVSRVLYSQLGSVLNYGYLGDTPTAPGQWSAALLKQAIANTEEM
ncbi:type I 3-dehydroquinate dehydratase [Akkermansiaceae bacterium]|nr:type I 3-dehydroquinate dehydratase [Akkermansiaceae bacterium]